MIGVSIRSARLGAAVLGAVGALAVAAPATADEGFRVSQTCAGCHGTNGASPGDTIPILGGQNAAYLADSMRAYKSGDRDYYVMRIIANGFDNNQIDAMAGWFADQAWVPTSGAVDAALAESGKAVAESACAGCHGNGEASDAAPRLAGQSAAYLILAAQAYKSGARGHAAAAAALKGVSDADIEAASHYYASLR